MDCSNGIPINPDVSGKGVRVALYVQSILTVILIRVSPEDAATAYWSMSSTAIALICTTFITGTGSESSRSISLLDAIVVVYLLLLPVLASTFGISRLILDSHRLASPILILTNWARSALTYAFALYVWATASTFGSAIECNPSTRFILFGASLPALGSGRVLNLVIWGIGSGFFTIRLLHLSTLDTLWICVRALFSETARNRLLRPRRPPPSNEWIFEEVRHRETELGRETVDQHDPVRIYRKPHAFYTVIRGLTSMIFGRSGNVLGDTISLVIAAVLAIFAIVMTELELYLNGSEGGEGSWGFGQVLPLVLTIQPLIALMDVLFSKHTVGPGRHHKTIRLTVDSAAGLQHNGSPFCVITCGDQLHATYDVEENKNPTWGEAFDLKIDDVSPIVIRVFHLRSRKIPILLGYTTFLPLDLLSQKETKKIAGLLTYPPPVGSSNSGALSPPPIANPAVSSSTATNKYGFSEGPTPGADAPADGQHTRLLWRDGEIVQGAAIFVSLSEDVSEPIPPAIPPQSVHSGGKRGYSDQQSKGFYFKLGYGKFSKTWSTTTNRSRVRA